MLHVDSRKDQVDVPLNYQGNPALTLKLSYFFQGETTHDESAVISYLKFDGQYAQCSIPWAAIWGITSSDGENRVWPEDVPREVFVKMARNKLVEAGKKLFGKEKASTSSNEPTESTKTNGSESKAKRDSHLKRIK